MHQTADNPELEHLRKVATPLRLGETLAPHMWGPRVKFRADPWLLDAEAFIMELFTDFENERFGKMNAPPQVSKSTLLEVLTPMWVLGHYPDTRIILIAYSDDLAVKNGALVRDLMMRFGPEFWGVTVDPKYESKQEWRMAGRQGGMLSVGIGSKITGQPGDLVLVGDAIKTLEEAGSDATKRKHWDEFNGAILPRIQPGGTILMAATRFAEDDLGGRIDEMTSQPEYDGDEWESRVYKAIAEPDDDEDVEDEDAWRDHLGRRIGEPLQTRFAKPGDEAEENWERSHFYRRRRAMIAAGQTFMFSCLYQQTPTAPGGGMFPEEKWGWYDPDEVPHMNLLRRSWDLAASEGAGDWSTGGKVGRDGRNRYFVLDLTRFRKGPDDVLTEVKQTAALTDSPAVPILIEEERNGAGKTVIAFYKRELEGYTVKASEATGSKEDRARPYSTLQNRGAVLLPRSKDGSSPEWVRPFVKEHRKMMGDGRRGRHDDMIDVIAHAINDMIPASGAFLLDPNLRMNNVTGSVVFGAEFDDDIDVDVPAEV